MKAHKYWELERTEKDNKIIYKLKRKKEIGKWKAVNIIDLLLVLTKLNLVKLHNLTEYASL